MKTAQVKTITATADSLEEARRNIREQTPEGFFLLSEQVIADGRDLETVKASAETTDLAFREAEARLPGHVVIVEKKTLVAPLRSTVQIEAFSEQEARSVAQRSLPDTAMITAVKMLSTGAKGFLGMGRKPNRYQCETLQQAVVAITYRVQPQVSAKVGDRNSVLVRAAGEGDVGRVTDLLDQGADVDCVDAEGFTPLRRASFSGHADTVRLLLARGADVGNKSSSGTTALQGAFAYNHVEAVEALLAAGANPDEEIKEGVTPLMGAAVEANVDMLKVLLRAGANVNATMKNGATALMGVASFGNVAIGKLLLDHDADPNISAAENGKTALIEASQQGHMEFVRMLLARGARVDAKMNDGKTALMGVASFGNVAIGKLLLDHDADPNLSAAEDGKTALIEASQQGHNEFVRMLLARGARVDAKMNDGKTALFPAAINGHTAVVRSLLDFGADVNQRDEGGNTALIGATLNGNVEVAKLLIDSGAAVNARNNKGMTALGAVSISLLLGVSYERQTELISVLTRAGGVR